MKVGITVVEVEVAEAKEGKEGEELTDSSVIRRGRGSSGLRVREPQIFNKFGRNYSQVSGSPINPSSCTMAGSEINIMIRKSME